MADTITVDIMTASVPKGLLSQVSLELTLHSGLDPHNGDVEAKNIRIGEDRKEGKGEEA